MNSSLSIKLGNVSVSFHMTCRVPNNQVSALPASLGMFQLYKVDQLAEDKRPAGWKDGAYFLTIYPQEAMWMRFTALAGQDSALVVGAGMVNAVTGKKLADTLEAGSYMVVPSQPWLDGFKTLEGTVRQFVAAELGSGQTAEEQILGTSEGGLQLGVYDRRVPVAAPMFEESEMPNMADRGILRSVNVSKSVQMGFGAGGQITQKIYADTEGVDTWRPEPTEKALVYMVSPVMFEEITGQPAPPCAVTYADYVAKGLPWFLTDDDRWADTTGSQVLADLKPVDDDSPPATVEPTKPNSIKLW